MSNVTSLSDAMKEMIGKKKSLKNGLHTAQIEEIWKEIIGQAAIYTDKVQIIGQTLFIYSSNGALKNELHFQRKLIIARVNDAFGENVIDKIVIK